jgi:D-alanine-D-alanine ligase
VQSSVLPSVAGLVPEKVPVICGFGPVAKNRYTPQEAVSRISLIQRTLLLSEFLVEEL